MRHHWSSTRRRVPSNTSTCDSPVSPGRNRLQLAQKLVASGMVSISGSDVCITPGGTGPEGVHSPALVP